MLTKLGKACLAVTRFGGTQSFIGFSTNLSLPVKCSKKVKDYTGAEKYISMVPYGASFGPKVGAITNGPGIFFGSGNTPASEDDYTLENLITSGISVTASPSDYTGNYFYDEDSNSEIGYLTYTITNTGSSSVTISEIGLFSLFQTASGYGVAPSSGSSNRSYFLIERIVLDTPLVIAAGSSAVLRYEIVFPGDVIS